jgi:hypothetical protein
MAALKTVAEDPINQHDVSGLVPGFGNDFCMCGIGRLFRPEGLGSGTAAYSAKDAQAILKGTATVKVGKGTRKNFTKKNTIYASEVSARKAGMRWVGKNPSSELLANGQTLWRATDGSGRTYRTAGKKTDNGGNQYGRSVLGQEGKTGGFHIRHPECRLRSNLRSFPDSEQRDCRFLHVAPMGPNRILPHRRRLGRSRLPMGLVGKTTTADLGN